MTDHATIDASKCISCGYCVAICRQNAIGFSWEISAEIFQRRLAEYAFGAILACRNRLFCYNMLLNMAVNCDCMKDGGGWLCGDIGIVAGTDAVAVDAASLALVREVAGDVFRRVRQGVPVDLQVEHLARLGGGNKRFRLIEV